jgi:hypothetical protein
MIREKKANVGAGYLTDQGALFLVASDLNIALKFDPSNRRTRFSELTSDQRGVTVVARILSIGVPKQFARVDREGFLLKILLFDESGTILSSTVWDYSIGKKIISEAGPGTAIKISNCYSRANLDGSQTINIAEGSALEFLKEGDSISEKIPTPQALAHDCSQVTSTMSKSPLVVRGIIDETPQKVEFTRSRDNTQSHFLSFSLKSESSASSVRVVIWANSNPALEKVGKSETITLANVRARQSNFQGSDSIELHGDDATIVLEKWSDTKSWLSQQLNELDNSFAKGAGKTASQKQLPAFIGRILASDVVVQPTESAHFLIIDARGRKISITALDDAILEAAALKIDDLILCKPDTFDESGLRATCRTKASIAKLKVERKDIPQSEALLERIEQFAVGSIISLDSMVISEVQSREIQTKDGNFARRSEVSLADPSGEVTLYAWRNLSKSLDGLHPGMKILVRGAEVHEHEGKKFLLLKNYSRIDRRDES